MLFQKNIIKKYTDAAPQETVAQAWLQYKQYFLNSDIQKNIRQSKEEQFQEGFLRELFVKVLGYTLNPSPDYNLITEQKNETNSKKADGAILVDGKVVGVIELKDHKTTDLSKIEQQAFGYKNQNQNAVYVVISNFEKLRFYIDNAVECVEFDLFHLTENEFGTLWLCLAWPNIAANLPKRIKAESVSSEDAITNALYKDYTTFKQVLYQDILLHNKGARPLADDIHLYKKTQKLLDRLLFIFFAEDSGLLPPNTMVKIIADWEKLSELDAYVPLYNRIKKYFGYLDTGYKGKDIEIFAYNGGLFKPDEVLDSLVISDDVLAAHTRRLSEYDYKSEVDVNILGHIFENSLSEIETMGHAPLSEHAPLSNIGKRKRDGVFYTPQYITKYIVENTVGRLCTDKKAELQINEQEYFADKQRKSSAKRALLEKLDAYRQWLSQITICDPACGSGAFLNAALNFLIAEHCLVDEMEAKVLERPMVIPQIENSILENNLFGVDINEESVEIAKLSLWLRTAKPHRKLNSLNKNIKCGNSLLSPWNIAREHSTRGHAPLSGTELPEIDITRGHAPLSETSYAPLSETSHSPLSDTMSAFDWYREFPQVFHEKNNRIWHITTATHDSRTSQRMIDYKVRLLRFHGAKPYADPTWIDEIEEQIITETFAQIVKNDKLKIPAYNICGDHMHFILVCEEGEVSKIVGKIKSMTSRAVNIAMGRTIPSTRGHAPLSGTELSEIDTTRGHAPLSETLDSPLSDSTPERGETQCQLWAQKYGCVEIDTEEYLRNTIDYIKNNRLKHELPPLKNIDIVPICTFDEIFMPEYTGGFDVVIGNPPYVQLQSMGAMSDVYAQCGFESYNKSADLYCLFYEQGCKLLRNNGLLGFIASNKWLKVNYGIPLRKYLTTAVNPYLLVDFPGVPVFADATVDPQILLLSKEPYKGKTFACICKQTNDMATYIDENKIETTFNDSAWAIPDNSSKIFEKISRCKTLKDLPITINYGIKTGFNDAFFIDGETRSRLIAEDPKSAELIKPLLRGRDIQAWVPNDDLFLINPHNGVKSAGIKPINIDDYPAIKTHLNQFYDKLAKRFDKGITPYNLRNCDYLAEFSKPKIMYPNMTKYLPFIYDEKGYLGNDKTFIITTHDNNFSLKALVAIFNSNFAKAWIRKNCPELGDDRREIRKVYFENFPVPDAIYSKETSNKGACPLVEGESVSYADREDGGACPLVEGESVSYADGRDGAVCSLADYADKMLTLNSDLQQKVSRFLRRIRETYNLEKTTATLETFYTLSFSDFVKELGKQKVKLTLVQKDELEDYFNTYTTECQALKAAIATTDREIDQVVYALYGLTDEEVKVVENQ